MGGFPYPFPIAFTGTNVKQLRQALCKEIGDVIGGACTFTATGNGNVGGTTVVCSDWTSLPADWFRTGAGGEIPTAIKITSGLYDGKTCYVSSFDNSTGTVTVAGGFGGKIESAITGEVHRMGHPDLKDTCIANAAKDAYPFLYDYVKSEAFVWGDCLTDGSIEAWSNSTTPAYWTASSVSTTRSSTYTWESEYSCALSTTTGYIEQTVSHLVDLQMLGQTTPTFYARVRAGTASQVRLAIYDGTTTTYGDYNTTTGAWELLKVSATIADNPSAFSVRIYYANTATTAYVDDAHCINAVDIFDYDISNLYLVNDVPENIYVIPGNEADSTYPRPRAQAVLCREWETMPNGYIRFTKALTHGTRLRIVGRKYLSVRDATNAAVAAGASFLDLDDVDDTTYTGKATYNVVVNATETGLELAASAASQHTLGSAVAHAADTLANINALVSDATIASTANIATHAALDTGVHGVGASTVASALDLTTHAALETGAHGITGTILGTEDIDDTAGGTTGETDMAASSNAFYDHCVDTTTHGATGAIVGTTNTQTLTLKTLTLPVIASFYQDAGLTKLMTTPNTASDTLCAIAATQTLTNKTIQAAVATGTWTSTAWVLPSAVLGASAELAFSHATYYPMAFIPAATITEDHATSTLFDAIDVTDTKVIWTSPANVTVWGIKMRLLEQFAAPTLTDFTITVGSGADPDGYLAGGAIMTGSVQVDANTCFSVKGALCDTTGSGGLYCAAATAFTATATANAGCNLSTLTAGTVEFRIAYSQY